MNSHLSALACAALSTHAGRNQRALPDKRARRKPGWLDNSVDPKAAAQTALPHATGAADVSLAAALPVGVLICLAKAAAWAHAIWVLVAAGIHLWGCAMEFAMSAEHVSGLRLAV